MAQKKILSTLAPFVIGLLFIEIGLFCYSFYDPTMGALHWFPYRDYAIFLLGAGVMALIIGTLYTLATEMEEDKT